MLSALHQRFQPPQVFAVQRLRRAEVHRDAVLHHAVLLENPVEHVQRTSAIDHEIFRDDFKPVADRLLFQDVVVVRNAQADAYAVFSKPVEAICRHIGKLQANK